MARSSHVTNRRPPSAVRTDQWYAPPPSNTSSSRTTFIPQVSPSSERTASTGTANKGLRTTITVAIKRTKIGPKLPTSRRDTTLGRQGQVSHDVVTRVAAALFDPLGEVVVDLDEATPDLDHSCSLT